MSGKQVAQESDAKVNRGEAYQKEEHASVQRSIEALRKAIEKAEAENRELRVRWGNDRSMDEASKITGEHIERLHRYNDIKDAAQAIFGKLAELEGRMVRDVYRDFGVDLKD
ncbi:hypothetical protein EV182_000336 [Spiromyces aspiralis]|uniref:Uncharacterized protein n=1 Tax=Spiromyces aspiralis TaxID=68401 RepID=A0ACC1HKX3_9FUNG|nr:hypothetical protein EV182_000336 [Spiromyces aspiralis]